MPPNHLPNLMVIIYGVFPNPSKSRLFLGKLIIKPLYFCLCIRTFLNRASNFAFKNVVLGFKCANV